MTDDKATGLRVMTVLAWVTILLTASYGLYRLFAGLNGAVGVLAIAALFAGIELLPDESDYQKAVAGCIMLIVLVLFLVAGLLGLHL